MKWCVADKFDNANHKPVVEIKGALDRTVKSGETVILEADITDPDGDEKFTSTRSILWWQYKEAGTYNGMVETTNPRNRTISFIAPYVSRPETIHMIIEATDNGKPRLTAFKRVIITIMPY